LELAVISALPLTLVSEADPAPRVDTSAVGCSSLAPMTTELTPLAEGANEVTVAEDIFSAGTARGVLTAGGATGGTTGGTTPLLGLVAD
jgi:hypothetical protein